MALTPCAVAAAPEGPRLAFVSLTDSKQNEVRLESVDPSGSGRVGLLHANLGRGVGPVPFFGPSWSADGTRVFFGAFAGKRRQAIYAIRSDGSGLRSIPRTKGATNPVLSPDGHTLAFARSRFRFDIDVHHPGKTRFYASTTTWIVDLDSGRTRQLTRWRNGLENTPASFSPDGSTLALTRNDDNLDGPRAVLMHLGGGSTVLAREAVEPVISPDGSRVALISFADQDVVQLDEEATLAGELYVVRVDGSQLQRLTRTRGQSELRPSWDPSSQRIAYNQFRAGEGLDELFPFGNSIMQINADGSCRAKILSVPRVALYGAAWQPGPGREAGRIVC